MFSRSARASDVPTESPVSSRCAPVLPCLLGTLLICGTVSGQGTTDLSTFYTITDPRTASSVVARVGTLEITAREFLLSYEFGPAFPKRRKDSKERYLEFMTYEKLLALDGYARGLDRSPRVREALAEIEADLATEELFRDDVMSRVRVSGAEVEAGARQQLVTLSLRWLYAPARQEIMLLARQLASGSAFDSLYRSRSSDSTSKDDRSLEMTRFKLRRSNPMVARMADTLRLRVPSAPVKGSDGWYILYLDNLSASLLPTESEAAKLRYDAKRAIAEEKSDSLADVYVNRIMLKRKPVIIRSSFDALAEYMARKAVTPALYDEWRLSNFRRDDGPRGKDTLVTLAGGAAFLREDFERWFVARETAIHLSRQSSNAYLGSLEQFIWRMVRDRLLTKQALSRGFQLRENVKTQKKWWEQKFLYEVVRGEIAQSVIVSDSIAEQFFRDNRRRYLSTTGDTLSFALARDAVRRDVFDAEFSKRLLHTMSSLKRKHPVTVDTKLLGKLPVESENDPRAIDVYTVKKGGILPRQAFPAIDYQWKAWE